MASPKTQIRAKFRSLSATDFKVTSLQDRRYNCIGWAAEEDDRLWWPNNVWYWPSGFPLDVTLENFVAVFASLGYEKCDSLNLENGFQKVVIYTSQGRPTHMARQLPNGRWTSKLGQQWDIEHKTPVGIAGTEYGQVTAILRRPIA